MKKDMRPENLSMVRTEMNINEAVSWLKYVLNPDIEEPAITDWMSVYVFAKKQALTGICLPKKTPYNISKETLLQWIGHVHLIEQQNKLLNKRIEQLFGVLEQEGFKCCLLKGQGNAEMYPDSLRRCSGDIDIWVDSSKEIVYQYVKKTCPNAGESFKHIHLPIFRDAKVDIHVTPLKFYSSHYHNKLQHWIILNKGEQFAHKIRLTGTNMDINVPTCKFNAIYQLGHMLIHLFDEGLGFRQVVDYFYVLKNLDVTNDESVGLVEDIKTLGLFRFAGALMWIESNVLGLPVERCIVEPNELCGKKLLNDIIEGGNFGHHSERYHGNSSFYYRGIVEALRDIRFFPIYPRECAAKMLNKLGTAVRHAFI